MKCPACKKRAVSFGTWGRGMVAFRWTCPHCTEPLRASRGTVAAFIFMLALIPLLIFISERVADRFQIQDSGSRRMVFAAVMVPSLLALSFLVWSTGSYRSGTRVVEPATGAGGLTRGHLLVLLGLIVIGVMTWFRGYHAILLFTGNEAVARVVEYQPNKDSGVGEWRMTYEFAAGGAPQRGTASFARLARPEDEVEFVRIKYLPVAPSVSGVVGHLPVAGLMAYGMALIIMWQGVQFIRVGRRLVARADEP